MFSGLKYEICTVKVLTEYERFEIDQFEGVKLQFGVANLQLDRECILAA